MARRYAEGTKVEIEQSKMEIERLLRRHGASGFASGWDGETGTALLAFQLDGRMVRFKVQRPKRDDVATTSGGYTRSRKKIGEAIEKEHRRRWRALLLIIKAKMEIVSSGESTFEREFMADLTLPDGQSFGDWAGPQIKRAYETGQMPSMLLLTDGRPEK